MMNTISKPVLELTTVHLSPDEIALFIEFQKRRKLMEVLAAADAFSVKGGSVTIHFTNDGTVGSVDVQRRYKVI